MIHPKPMKMTLFSFFVRWWSTGEGFMHSSAFSFRVGDCSTKMKNMTSFHYVSGHMLPHSTSCFQCTPCINQVKYKYCAAPSTQKVGPVTPLEIWNLTFSANVKLNFLLKMAGSVLAQTQTCSAQQQGSLLGIVEYCLSRRHPLSSNNIWQPDFMMHKVELKYFMIKGFYSSKYFSFAVIMPEINQSPVSPKLPTDSAWGLYARWWSTLSAASRSY